VTSRPYGYEEQPPQFKSETAVFRPAGLTAGQQRELVTSWFRPRAVPAHLEALLARNPAVQNMAVNGFLLALLCGISEAAAVPDDVTRPRLYELALEQILGGKGRAAKWQVALQDLAWGRFQTDARRLLISQGDLDDFLCTHKRRPSVEGRPGEVKGLAVQEKVDRLIEELRKKRLLVRVGATGGWMFSHRRCAEYLPAQSLA